MEAELKRIIKELFNVAYIRVRPGTPARGGGSAPPPSSALLEPPCDSSRSEEFQRGGGIYGVGQSAASEAKWPRQSSAALLLPQVVHLPDRSDECNFERQVNHRGSKSFNLFTKKERTADREI